jgi:hypothetical protein
MKYRDFSGLASDSALDLDALREQLGKMSDFERAARA